jgi:hypothetical protein
LFIEEGLAELLSEQRDVFNNSLTDTPLFVSGKLYNSW